MLALMTRAGMKHPFFNTISNVVFFWGGGVDSVHRKFCWSCTVTPVWEGFWFQFLFVGTRTPWQRSDKFKVLKK